MIHAELKTWIGAHPFRSELHPLAEVRDHRVVRVGLRLTLSTECGSCGFRPGSPEHRALYEGLKAVASAVLPAPDGTTRCEIEPYEARSYLEDGRPSVEVTVRIVHAHGYFRPLDAEEWAGAQAIQSRLSELQPETRRLRDADLARRWPAA